MHVPFPQNLQRLRRLQSHEQRTELRYGRMRRSVTSLLSVNGYTSHSSMVNTSQPMALSSTTNVSTRSASRVSMWVFNHTITLYVSSISFSRFWLGRRATLSAKTTSIASSPRMSSAGSQNQMRSLPHIQNITQNISFSNNNTNAPNMEPKSIGFTFSPRNVGPYPWRIGEESRNWRYITSQGQRTIYMIPSAGHW